VFNRNALRDSGARQRKAMKILITGGSGFIGRNLKEQLQNTCTVLAPSSSELNLLHESDVKEYLARYHFDVIIHSATWDATRFSSKDPAKVLPHNLRMFYNLVRCSDSFGKLIHFGSGAEYDRSHCIPRMNEEYFDTHVPADDYGFSKYIISKHTLNADRILELCLFGVFGKYEDWRIRFISNACCRAVWDMPITIKQNIVFDYLFVDDLVKITDWFIYHDTGEKRYNICRGDTYELLTLARKILDISGKNLEIAVRNEGLGKEYSGDNSRFLRETGGFSFCDIDESIEDLYHWYETKKEQIDRELLLNEP